MEFIHNKPKTITEIIKSASHFRDIFWLLHVAIFIVFSWSNNNQFHYTTEIKVKYEVPTMFPDFFSYGHFYWQYTHETIVPFEVISSGCNALVVPFQQLLEGLMEVLLCERVNDLRHSLFHLLNCLITTASVLRE